jgi:hypothetical protein
MAMKLNVPFVTQHNIGGHVVKKSFFGLIKKKVRGWDDWTGCWYASACMVGYYFEAGPRRGLPEIFVAGQGHLATGSDAAYALEQKHHDLLAKRENLIAVEQCSSTHQFTLEEIESLLKDGGPIFMYWTKSTGSSSYGHASVIIGTTSAGIIYHDPENAPDSVMSIGTFNNVRQKWQYALMQKNFVTNRKLGSGAKRI